MLQQYFFSLPLTLVQNKPERLSHIRFSGMSYYCLKGYSPTLRGHSHNTKWAQHARVLHYSKHERLAKDKHSNLFNPFVNNKENKVL